MTEMGKIKGVSMHSCVNWLNMSDILLLITEAYALNWPSQHSASFLWVFLCFRSLQVFGWIVNMKMSPYGIYGNMGPELLSWYILIPQLNAHALERTTVKCVCWEWGGGSWISKLLIWISTVGTQKMDVIYYNNNKNLKRSVSEISNH